MAQTPTRFLPALLLGVLSSFAAAQEMTHSAPWLGKSLTVELAGLPAGAPYVVLGSTGAADVATPFGALGIDLGAAFPLASGAADATGAVQFALPVPANVKFAEVPLHLQAFYLDASHPAGGALVPAKHLRLLGSRFYMSRANEALPGDTRFSVYASRGLAPVFEFLVPTFGMDAAFGVLVSRDGSRAMYSVAGLVRFDNFFGAASETVEIAVSSPAERTSDGEAVLVLGTLGSTVRLWRVPFEFGASPEILPVTVPFGSGFAYEPESESVWVATTPAGDGSPRVALVDLASGATTATRIVGGPTTPGIRAIVRAGERLVVGLRSETPFPSMPTDIWVSVTDLAAAGDAAVHHVGSFSFPWRVAGRLETSGHLAITVTQAVGFGKQWLVDLTAPPTSAPLGVTGPSGQPNHAFQTPAGTFVFDPGFSEPPDGDEPGLLLDLDVQLGVLTLLPLPYLGEAYTAAHTTDFSGTRVVIASYPLFFGDPGPIHVYDPASGTTTTLHFDHEYARVSAVSIP